MTDGYTKILRFTDKENHHSSLQINAQDEIDENTRSMSLYEIYVRQISISLISVKKELLTVYFQKIVSRIVDTDIDTKCEFELGYLQIDNQSENDPIFPVLLKPKYLKPDVIAEEEEEEDKSNKSSSSSSHKSQFNSQPGVFQLSLDFRKNIPHVIYFELIDYLL